MMDKINLSHSDYTKLSSTYQLSLAIDFPILVPKNDPVRLLNQFLDHLDYKNLEATYSEEGRNPVVPPKILFKVLIYGYMNRAYSSRDIATLCRRDINFIWLLNGFNAPSHHTIARFRSKRLVEGIMEDLFAQFIELLFELDEVSFENLFIDGTKNEANANRYSFVWIRGVSKYFMKRLKRSVPFMKRAMGSSRFQIQLRCSTCW